MSVVLHVIDGSCDETQWQVLRVLRARLSDDGGRHAVCSIDGPMAARAAAHWGEDVLRTERHGPRAMNWAPQLPSVAQRTGAKVVHAWGVEAAAACSARLLDLPLVLTLLYPDTAHDAATWLRSFPTDATVAVGSQLMRSRLLAAGVAPERLVVIRGPADFAAINRARKQDIRRSVVGDAHPVLLVSGPPSRSAGTHDGIWAAAVLKQVHPNLRIIMPYDSPEGRRVQRFARSTRIPNLLTVPDARLTWPQLVTCADVFVVPAVDEVCTEPILTAMAAGVVVVATAVRSVAELIGDRHTGLLCKAGDPRLVADRILTAIEDADLRHRVTQTARAQVYEVSSIRAFADNYARLYRNLVLGKAPGDGVRDTAMVA